MFLKCKPEWWLGCGLAWTLIGCGGDADKDIKISELQNKVLSMSVDLENTRKDHAQKVQELSDKIDKQASEIQRLKLKGGSVTQGVDPSSRVQKSLRSREQMRAEAYKRTKMQREGLLEQRAVAIVRSLLNTHSIEQIPTFLNQKGVDSPEGIPWTVERVKVLMKEHRLQRRAGVVKTE